MAIKYPLPPTIDPARLPKHIGIIMDGNGRWAQQHKVKIALGHRAGTENLREIIRNCSDIGIQALSLYAFSTENWKRSKTEVDALMQSDPGLFCQRDRRAGAQQRPHHHSGRQGRSARAPAGSAGGRGAPHLRSARSAAEHRRELRRPGGAGSGGAPAGGGSPGRSARPWIRSTSRPLRIIFTLLVCRMWTY